MVSVDVLGSHRDVWALVKVSSLSDREGCWWFDVISFISAY